MPEYLVVLAFFKYRKEKQDIYVKIWKYLIYSSSHSILDLYFHFIQAWSLSITPSSDKWIQDKFQNCWVTKLFNLESRYSSFIADLFILLFHISRIQIELSSIVVRNQKKSIYQDKNKNLVVTKRPRVVRVNCDMIKKIEAEFI